VDTDRREHFPAVPLVAIFGVGRAAYFALGVRFLAADELKYLPQLLAPDLLRHHLVQSIWYLHAQPPLFNALVGVVLSWSPFPAAFSLQVVYLLAGLALTLGLYDLARQLGFARTPAIVVTAVVACGPPVVLWENVLNYDYLVAVLLVLAIDAVARWVRNGNAAALAAAVSLTATVVLLRSFMHPVFFAGVIVLVLLLRRPARWNWRPVAAVAVPFALVAGTMLKNEVIFGSPQLSSWLGYNVHRVAIGQMSAERVADLRARGILEAPDFAPPCTPSHPGVPALALQYKPGVSPPQLNENWDCLRKYRDDLTSDSIRVARDQPGWIAHEVAGSVELWASPSTLYWEGHENTHRISWLDRAYRIVPLGDVPWSPPIEPGANPYAGVYLVPDGHYHLSLTIVLATLLAIGAGTVASYEWFRRGRRSPARAAYIAGGFTVLYATAVAILLEHGENNRLRFMVEPLTLVLAAAAVAALARRLFQRRVVRRAVVDAGAADVAGAGVQVGQELVDDGSIAGADRRV
jgi:hypothetical protein